MRTTLIALLTLISVTVSAQIEIPLSNIPADEYLRDTNIVVATIPANSGQVDSFGYITTVYPTFISDDGYVTMQQVDNAWNNRQFKNDEYIIGGLVYKPSRTKHFAALRNRIGIALVQNVKIYKPQMAEMSNDQQFWYLYEYMIENNIPNETFWNNQQVIDLITEDEVITPPIDTL